MTRRVLPTALLLACAAVAAPVPKALKKPATLQGDWRIVGEERNGQPAPRGTSSTSLWRVSEGRLVLISEGRTGPDREFDGVLITTPGDGTRPGAFEYTLHRNGYNRRGVFELDGDTLRVAFGKDPKTPPERLTSDASGYLYTFERAE